MLTELLFFQLLDYEQFLFKMRLKLKFPFFFCSDMDANNLLSRKRTSIPIFSFRSKTTFYRVVGYFPQHILDIVNGE